VIGEIAGQKYVAAAWTYYVGFSHVRGRQRLTLKKEVPLMSILTMSLPATRWGAALLGARMPQAMFEPLGQLDVLLPGNGSPLPAPRSVALTGSVLTSTVAPTGAVLTSTVALTGTAASGVTAGPGTACVAGAGNEAVAGTGVAKRRPSAINGRPTDNRKQQYVHKTRVNAGGDGASGPEPERERALPTR
jgi:hypothetical protein